MVDEFSRAARYPASEFYQAWFTVILRIGTQYSIPNLRIARAVSPFNLKDTTQTLVIENQ